EKRHVMHGWWARCKTLLVRWLPFLPVSWHRKAMAWLSRQGYKPVEALSWGKAYRVEKGGRQFVFKRLTAQGLKIWQEILCKLQGAFRRLVIPEAVAFGEDKWLGCWVLRRWLEGQPMCADWSELVEPGGVCLPMDRVEKVVDLLEDLARIDPSLFLTTHLPRRDQRFLQKQISQETAQAEQQGLLSLAEIGRIWYLVEPILSCAETGPWRLSNHDFYFRNFLELPDGRVALLDWEVARVSSFEIEHCTSYLWMLLWNHPQWRQEFLKQVKQRLGIDRQKFRAALLVNALHQAMFVWKNQPALQTKMIQLLRNALDDQQMAAIWQPEQEATKIPLER
ncbi:MAG: aminoglycoside phosphotransferase family protein, partial [Thermoguttaceae bacterium]|nr:aminoglycoside phosphotransferase family protein [Thermoguttaceae bacterium]MDW8039462.1 hypothetical protein [Thermoguttaceae bacterium]